MICSYSDESVEEACVRAIRKGALDDIGFACRDTICVIENCADRIIVSWENKPFGHLRSSREIVSLTIANLLSWAMTWPD